MTPLSGKVVEVIVESAGSTLDGAHTSGATVLTVAEVFDFDPEGGRLQVDTDAEAVEYDFLSVDEEASTILLASGLTVDVEDGAPVLLLPEAPVKTASVALDLDSDESIEDVRVPHALDPLLAEGIRDPEAAETVTLTREADGEWTIADVIGRRPVIDGNSIDPDTLPPSPPPAPVQPDSSPEPTVDGFAGVVLLRWVGILNDSPVTYEVHVATTDASPPDATTFLDDTAATAHSVRTLPDDTKLVAETTYYFALWAKSGDLYSPDPSPWVPGQMDLTRSADLAADAIDGMLITGATLRTASAGAREEITTAEGYQSFDSAGNAQTQIKDGKLITTDGEFSGTVTGSSIVGGSIAIAQGVASTLDEAFSTASGTTPPAGWVRTVVASSGTGGGADFVTTGGHPGRYLRLRTAQVIQGQEVTQTVYPTSVWAQDQTVEFDYKWSGPEVNILSALYVHLRATTPTSWSPGPNAITISLGNGILHVYEDAAVHPDTGTRLAIDTWYRLRLTLRGYSLLIEATPDGGSPLPLRVVTLQGLPVAGFPVFVTSTTNVNSTTSPTQTVSIDNVHIDVLQTGLSVAPDGGVIAERLTVNQSAEVPDPLMPLDAVNLRTLDAAATPTIAGSVTDASGYVTSSLNLFKVGQVVHFSITVVRSANPASSGYITFTTVPSGFRPSGVVPLNVGVQSVTATWTPKARINADGTAQIAMSPTGGSSNGMNITGTWLAAA